MDAHLSDLGEMHRLEVRFCITDCYQTDPNLRLERTRRLSDCGSDFGWNLGRNGEAKGMDADPIPTIIWLWLAGVQGLARIKLDYGLRVVTARGTTVDGPRGL